MEECIFSLNYEANCKKNEQLSQNRDKRRIESIIKASNMREDTLQKKLVSLLENDPELKVKYHLSSAGKCYSTNAVLKDRPEALKKDVNPMK